MLNGLQVAGSIDGALSQAQREAEVIDREVAHLTDRLIELTEEQGAVYQTLARLRLDSVRSGGVLRELSLADQRARQLIDRRETELSRVDRALAAAREGLNGIGQQRTVAQRQLAEVIERSKLSEQTVRAALQQDESYTRQRSAAETAIAIARHAAEKTEQAEQDRAIKGKPYVDDRLFNYLWERRYGTTEYQANPLARLLDGWVARLCGYRNAAANYRMLLEIPKRLSEHAERLRTTVAVETTKLREWEEQALSQGESGRCRQEIKEARIQLDAAEDRFEAAEQDVNRLLEAKNELTRGDDRETHEALEAIETSLRATSLRILREAAAGTPVREDDAAVRRLEAIEAQRKKIQVALENQKAIQLSQRRRMNELENVRREYRRKGYISDSWDFRSGDMLSVLLGEMLRGAITRDIFWDSMRQHQRPSLPDLGGEIPDWPGPGGGDSLSLPKGFGNGGFHTGGDF